MIRESQISTTQTESPYVLEANFMGKFIGVFIQSDNGEYYFDPKQGDGWLSASDLIIIYDKLQELNSTLIPNQTMKTNTLYRVDSYRNESGCLVGFYNTLDDAMLEIDGTPVGEDFDQSGRYYQLTTFTSPDDMPTMQAWTNELAEIQSTEYFD